MALQLPCPRCGLRSVYEFRFGGETRTPPGDTDLTRWYAYHFNRANVAGAQQELWFHRGGCHQWLVAERDTATNEVRSMRLLSEVGQ